MSDCWQVDVLRLIDAAEREMSSFRAWDYASRAVLLARSHCSVPISILGSRRWPDLWRLKQALTEEDAWKSS